jgi:hypothetical protein
MALTNGYQANGNGRQHNERPDAYGGTLNDSDRAALECYGTGISYGGGAG